MLAAMFAGLLPLLIWIAIGYYIALSLPALYPAHLPAFPGAAWFTVPKEALVVLALAVEVTALSLAFRHLHGGGTLQARGES
jgi:hypothetical protein